MKKIRINDYTYHLPEERIATHPLPNRSDARLLCYLKGKIQHQQFHEIGQFLPSGSTLFFNDTRVIPARLLFAKETGAKIEIFLLEPAVPGPIHEVMQQTGRIAWKCAIGNAKRWPKDVVLHNQLGDVIINAAWADHNSPVVELNWNPPHLSFAEIVQHIGKTPLPPYIKREAAPEDASRYQTVYSRLEGAVAAPTAGLHFTPEIIKELKDEGIHTDYLTLHVSAGTFQPVKTEWAQDHDMHDEQVIITQTNISSLLRASSLRVAVGTTSMRTLESLYWYGVKLLTKGDHPFVIEKTEPYSYDNTSLPDLTTAITAVERKMKSEGLETLVGRTSIYILPGYTFRVCDALITNFHQPGSTLMLLVAAFIGPDWEKVYQAALSEPYRFLSYGDSSLLIPKK